MFKNYSNACCVGLNLISNQSIIRMEPNTQALIKAAVDPLLAKIEQLEADNREFKARLDNIEAVTQQLKKGHTKPPTGKQPVPPKTGPVKDPKKATEPVTNGRPSNPSDKKIKQQDPTKKGPERPATGTVKTVPGAKSTGKKDETKKDDKKQQHKDDAHKSDQKSDDTKKDDGKHDPVKKDPKTLTSPKGPAKDTPKKDTKTPTHEPKATQAGKNTKSPGTTHDKKGGAATGQKIVPKGEKKNPDVEAAKKQQGKQQHKHQQAHQQQLLGEAEKAPQHKPVDPPAEVHHQAPAEVHHQAPAEVPPPPAVEPQAEKPAEPPVEAPAANLVAEPPADVPANPPADAPADPVPEAPAPDAAEAAVEPPKEAQEADVI